MRKPAPAEGLALDQPDEVGPSGEEVEVIGDGTGQDGLGAFIARERPSSAFTHSLPDFGERAVQNGLIEVRLGAKEVARGGAGDAGRRPTSLRLVAS